MYRLSLLVLASMALAGCGKDKAGSAASAGSATGSAGSAAEPAPAMPTVALPQVAGHGFETDAPVPRVVATPAAIFVDGKQVLALENGLVPGASPDRMIAAVVNGLSAPSRESRMVVALDKQLSYRLLTDVLVTLKSQGVRSFGVLAQAGGATVMLPIDLPNRSRPEPDSGRQPGSDLQRQINKVGGGARATEAKTGVSVEVREASVSPQSSLSGEIVKTKISGAYLMGIKRCIAKTTARDATPGGAIELTFPITAGGRGEKASVVGAPPGAGDCIAAQTPSWVFPKPKDGDIEGTQVTAKVTLDVTYHEADGAPALSGPADEPPVAVQTTPSPAVAPEDEPLRMVVSITTREAIVWSISGREGTLREPRLRVPVGPEAMGKVSALLADIVKRRWSGDGKHAVRDRSIILMAEDSVSMQSIADFLGAVRASAEGAELFPNVELSTSFE